jgi:hypothetical protein
MHCDCGCQPIVEEQVVFNLDVQSQRDEAWAKNLALAAQQVRVNRSGMYQARTVSSSSTNIVGTSTSCSGALGRLAQWDGT